MRDKCVPSGSDRSGGEKCSSSGACAGRRHPSAFLRFFFGHFLHPPGSSTHLSALTYSSSTGTQGTLPSLTPIWMSRNCRPRFSPRMVTLVPPWRGPVSGNNWRTEEEEEEERKKRIQDVLFFLDYCQTGYTHTHTDTHAHIPRAFIHKDTQQNCPYKVLSVVMRKNHPLTVERTMKMR